MGQESCQKEQLDTQQSLSFKLEMILEKTEDLEEITSKLKLLLWEQNLMMFLAKLLIKTMVNTLFNIRSMKNAKPK